MTTPISIAVTVNGTSREIEFEPQLTVLDLLRRKLNLLGTREGCGVGVCGSCTVLLDGKPVSSCLLLATNLDGRELLTIEGLGDSEQLDPVQVAFLRFNAYQCGFCTPGFVLAVKALLAADPRPSRDEIREILAGNICRCGTYAEVAQAVESLLKESGDRSPE